MMLALNINAGLSPERACQTFERQSPSPIVACVPAGPTRPEDTRRGKRFGEASIIFIDGTKK
jgi:hypothetical protein